MDYGAYLVADAASQSMLAQRVRASNMANVNTAGHKADYLWNTKRPFLQEMSEQQIKELESAESRIGVMTSAWGSRMTQGILKSTGRDLDLAFKTEGWFAIELPSEEEVYTRDGHFIITGRGDLVTRDGHPVIGHDGPIIFPDVKLIEVGENGAITAILPAGEQVQLGRLRLVNPPTDEMVKGEDGFFHYKNNKYIRYDPYAKIMSGTLESSNVNAVEEMIDYLSLARQFEVQIKSLASFDTMAAKGNELIKMAK